MAMLCAVNKGISEILNNLSVWPEFHLDALIYFAECEIVVYNLCLFRLA